VGAEKLLTSGACFSLRSFVPTEDRTPKPVATTGKRDVILSEAKNLPSMEAPAKTTERFFASLRMTNS
jgi:hypothetical protein